MKTKQLLFTLLTMLLPLVSWADVWQDPETKVNYEYTVGSGFASVKGDEYGYTGSPDAKGNITILSEITVGGRKYSVTSIGIYAFCGCSGLSSVTIPNSVTSIESYAFGYCSGLTSVTIPNSVTSIGGCAFVQCTSLTNFTIPNNITTIGASAFQYCTSLSSITIPSGVTNISYGTFEGCGLTDVTIMEGVTSIDDKAFFGCGMLKNITIPSSVTSIGGNAFWCCNSLTSFTIPENVTNIGYGAFTGCKRLFSVTSLITKPFDINDVFSDCKEMTLFVPAGTKDAYKTMNGWKDFMYIEEIGKAGIFTDNNVNYLYWVDKKEATVIRSPKASGGICILDKFSVEGDVYSVKSISDYAFYNIALKIVTIPSSITSIGYYAFQETGVNSVISLITEPFEIGYYEFYGRKTLYVPAGTIDLYKSTKGWNEFKNYKEIGGMWTDPETNVIYIYQDSNREAEVFYSPNAKDDITIRNSISIGMKEYTVTSISDNAFYQCSGLTSVTIPNSVTSIGDYAFMDCSGLTSIEIPNSVTSIGYNAFYNCSGLTSITIPNSVTSISSYAFQGCSGLTSVEIPNSVTRIESNAFYGCSGLTSISIPNSVTSIGVSAFRYCSGLTSITIPNSVTSIGSGAFSETGWYNNQSDGILYLDNWLLGYKGQKPTGLLVIVEGTKGLAQSVFDECRGLTSVTIPNSVTNIGVSAFQYCSGLTSITIPNSVTSIEHYAFSGCSNLTFVKIGNGVTTIGNYAFYGCSGLTSVTIPSSVTTIGNYAFSSCSGLTIIMSEIMKPFAISDVFSTDTYNTATLFVPIGTIDAYKTTKGWKKFKNIEEVGEIGSSLSLNVTNENGVDIPDKLSITWYDADGKQIGTGKSINGIEEGTELYYSVTFGEELGRVYREVNMQKVVVDGETVTCQLKKIGRVQLEGRVSATDIDKATMTVTIKQMLNGKWEQTYTVQTNEQGAFKVEVYDDVTDITISGDGYLDATLHRDGFSGNGNVGIIPVNLIFGFAIAANISVQKAVAEGEAEEMTTWTDGLNNIDFTLTNTTNGAAVTDFTVQNSNVIIKTGAGVGDNISLTAKSKQGMFADATTTFTIAEGANAFDLQLTELGGFDATCAVSNNGSTSGYLYNSNDVLVAKGSYVGETLSLRHLKCGVYTLISMGNSSLLGNMTRLSDLTAVGLTEGTDYVSTRIDVLDGELAAVNVSEVPQLDETQFYYTNNNTYFSANKASVTAGSYLTLQAHVDFKQQYADKADGVTLIIDLPEGCEMVENSVIANRQAVAHTINGSRVTMTLNKEQFSSQVRFCVIPTLNQNYTITAMAQFDIDGQVTQPIGTVQFEAKGLSLSVPELTARTNVTVNGTAKGHSEVSIYDNDVLIGKTSSKADGSWTAACELYKPYSHSFHDIYAKITTGAGMELTSETQQVEYDKNSLVPEKVTMLYRNYKVEFDLLQGTTSPSYYPYVPSIHDFTFLADFTRNDSTVIKNVNIKVLNSDGTVRTLPASFDGKQNKWVATTKYESSSRLPQNVAVDYDLLHIDIETDEECAEAEKANIRSYIDIFMNRAFSDNCVIVSDEDDACLIQYYVDNNNKRFIKLQKLKQSSIIDFADKCYQINDDNGNLQFCFLDSIESNKLSIYLWNDDDAYKIEVSDEQYANARRRAPIENPVIKGVEWVFGNGDMVQQYENYQRWCNIYEECVANHIRYSQVTQSLLLEKCNDGTYRLNPTNLEWYAMYKEIYSSDADLMETLFRKRLDDYLNSIKRRTYLRGAVQAAIFAASQLFQRFTQAGQAFKRWFQKDAWLETAETELENLVSSTISGNAEQFVPNNSLDHSMTLWYNSEERKIRSSFISLNESIRKYQKKCKNKESKEEDNDKPKNDNDNFHGKSSTPQIDPSGYVYEAVMSNRLEGVTATCYQKVIGEDMYGDPTEEAVVWNAADYSQVNPQLTDETGFYRWDVPQGMWQVKYEKEGYETAYSDWLPVPPPQLDVNIGMKQSTPPTVTQMRGFESGINIEMAKYMRPETMTTANITVTRNGAAEEGSIELLNTEKAPLGEETYVSKVRFVPENHFNTTDLVVVTVHKEVESYCGVTMTKDHVETVKIEPEVKSIVCDSVLTIPYQGTKELRVLVLPKDASAGKTLYVKTSSQMIASLSAEKVTIDQNGTATLTLGGELPGGAVLDYSVSGTDVTATSKVKVVMNRELVAAPMANISSGETIEGGTLLVLSCETEGATIYYTLDGSCPCDEATRYKYEGPIAIATDVIVKAIAVKDGMDDSEIVTFIYIVSGIQTPALAQNLNITCIDGLMTVEGADGCTVRVFDVAGRNLASRQNAGHKVTMRVPQSEEYIVSITTKDGHTMVRKMTGR